MDYTKPQKYIRIYYPHTLKLMDNKNFSFWIFTVCWGEATFSCKLPFFMIVRNEF